MSVNEKLMAPGTFSVNLNLEQTPNSIINKITPWGNIVLTPTRVQAEEFTDAQLRDMARYVGIVTAQEISEEGIEVSGKGILAYLGDSDSRGMVLARNAGTGAVRSYNRDTLDDVIDRSTSTPYGILRDEDAGQRAVRKGTVTEVQYDDTVLLLNFEGSDGDTSTTDGSAFTSNQVISFSGTSDISTDQAKYGSTSLHLTTDGFITVADRPELDLTYQEFTVEWWEYRTSSSGNPTVWARNNDTYSPWIFGKAVSGRNKAFITHDGQGYGTDEDLNMDMGSIDLNQWNHFAISHKGDLFRTYKNGTKVAELKRPELFVRVSSDSLQIGKGQDGNFFEGYLDGMVITRGNAKYWDDFTPSTSAPTATTDNKTYTGKHYLESAYRSIKTICTALDAEFKMQNDGTIDVGPRSSLFTGHDDSTPEGMIVRRLSGSDPNIKGYSGVDLSTEFNAEDYVSRVELTASQVGSTINLGQADAKDVPYKDLHGETLERIQILAENDIPDTMRDIRAEAYLNEYNKIQKTLNVGLEDYDISGDIDVGDIIYVYDPEVGFEDTSTDASLENRDRYEITYQGQILHPIKIRVMGLSFPISSDMGVFYRDKDGNYTDLTDYVQFETGITQIEVGATSKTINQDLRATGAIISGGSTNEFTVPDAPTNLTATSGTYQDGTGRPFAFVRLAWDEAVNTDGSRIIDGNMYRVRYRQVTDVDGNNLIDSNDNQVTDYEYLTVAFGTEAVIVKGLGASNTYEFGVQAIDNSGFSGGFAVLTAVQMPTDATVPPQPTAPEGSFGSLAGAAAEVTVTHKLGAAKDADGNVISSPTNFTLPLDIDHLNVYRGTTSNFTISAANLVGEIQARAGHIEHQIEVINTFRTATSGTAYYKVTAVDVAGNESEASTAAQVTEELIGTQYVKDSFITTAKIGTAQVTDAKIDTLTASKITAGTISGKEIIIDTDTATDPLNPVLGTIRSDNYVANTSGWIIKSDGSVEFESGDFRGDITGASGTFSGDLSAAGGTFAGDLSGAGGTFSGDISAASGTFTGDLSGADITGGTINIGNGTFQVDSSGNLTATSATLTGSITSTSGTIGGWTIGSTDLSSGNISIDSTGSISGNYTAGSAGWLIEADGDAFFNSIDIRVGGASSDTPSTGLTTLDIGSTQIYENNDDLFINTSGTNNFVNIRDRLKLTSTSSSGSNMQLMFDGPGSGDAMGFRHESDFPNSSNGDLIWTNQSGSGDYNKIAYVTTTDDYFHLGSDAPGIKTDYTGSPTLYFDGPGSPGTDSATFNMAIRPYAIKDKDGQVGSSGQILSSTGSRIDWIDAPSASGGVYSSFIQINGLTMQSGYNFDIEAASGASLSVSTRTSGGYAAVINHSDSDHSIPSIPNLSISNTSSNDASYPFLTAVSGHTLTRTRRVSATINTESINPRSFTGSWGGSNTLGSSPVNAFGSAYIATVNTSSDREVKENIVETDLGLDFINQLNPVKYNFKDSSYENPEGELVNNTYVRTHYGLISQDVKSVLETVQPDDYTNNALFFHMADDDGNYIGDENNFIGWGLRYTEFIAPLVKAVQELSAKNDELESRLAALEG